MYRVIRTYGDFEPWWFLDGWEENIVSSTEFKQYEEALTEYQRQWVCLSERFPMRESKHGTMTAFWNPDDQFWCEECDEYLQNYHSLLLIEAKEDLPPGLQRKGKGRQRPCQIKGMAVPHGSSQ